MTELKVGDVVSLPDKRLCATVEAIRGDMVDVVWFVGGDLRRAIYVSDLLRLVPDSGWSPRGAA